MYKIEDHWEALESDLREAEVLIRRFSDSTQYSEKVPEIPPDDSLFPYPVAEAYVYEGVPIIWAWRKHLDITHRDLSNRTGIDLGNLFRIERTGKMSSVEREKLADAMGITSQQLAVFE
ncbi:MAG: DNA-binding Xre family transcriptional regulator [Planctomycetaceae bacterium]|jgi:DNA-binding Xre family transcriptional regulator